MRVHYLQHVPFEGIGAIGEWARDRAHTLSGTEMFRLPEAGSPEVPQPDDLDLLVIMGGPMNVHQDSRYPWLRVEKDVIASAIAADKLVLGVCLGAQLVADVLGGVVTKGTHREIGWYPVDLKEAGREVPVFAEFPARFVALHWHGDTFSIPPGAVHVASSEACANQAFAYNDGRVIGLQFHLEETRESLESLIENARADLTVPDDRDAERWISTPGELLSPAAPYAPCRDLLFRLLDSMVMAPD
jgi:GMP synthase-like glutamine amidotransferase